MEYELQYLICEYFALSAVIAANIIVMPIFVTTVKEAFNSKRIERDVKKNKVNTICKYCVGGKKMSKENVRVIGTKIVLDGVDEYRKNVRIINKNMRELDGCLQSVWQNMERCNEALEEFNEQGALAFKNGRQGEADEVCANELTRKEIYQRTAVSLLKFVERVADGRGTTRTPQEEVLALPDAARVLLEVSKHLKY